MKSNPSGRSNVTHRIFLPEALAEACTVALRGSAFTHAVRVLRLREGDPLCVFNGDGSEYAARITAATRDQAEILLESRHHPATESPLPTTLLQAVGKGERMDWALQKATELGVTRIRPVTTRRCNVRIDDRRWQKKVNHWRGVIVAACEQSGRVVVPELLPVCDLGAALAECDAALRLMLAFDGDGDGALPAAAPDGVALLVGPEGGLDEAEIASARRAGFTGWRLGQRVLRTETAPVAALALLQQRYGDLG